MGVLDRLDECMLGDADAGPGELHLADIHGGERRIPRGLARVQHVGWGHGVIREPEFRNIHLAVHDILHERVSGVLRVGQEEQVIIGWIGRRSLRALHATEHRHAGGAVPIADVVLLAAGAPAAAVLGQHHVGGVDVGPVFALRESESEQSALREQLADQAPGLRIPARPDRPQAQHGDLPGVPVLERIPGKQLAQVVVACGVPAGSRRVGSAGQRSDRGRRAEPGEDAFAGDHLQEIVIPGRVVAFRLQGCVTLGLEKAAHGQQCAASRLVVMSSVVGGGIEEQHDSVTPGGRRGGCAMS